LQWRRWSFAAEPPSAPVSRYQGFSWLASRQSARFDDVGSRSILLKFARNTASLPLLGVLSFTACLSCSLPIPSPPHYQTQDATSPPGRVPRLRFLPQGRSLSASSLCPFLESFANRVRFLHHVSVLRFHAVSLRRSGQILSSSILLSCANDSRWKRPGIVDRYDLHKSPHVSGA
jgi:hypothetical protein